MKLTEQQVIDIARKRGEFSVSPRWRDDYLRSICKRLKKRGIFKQTEYGVTQTYVLQETEKQKE